MRTLVVIIGVTLTTAFAPFAYEHWRILANTLVVSPVLCTGDWENPHVLVEDASGIAQARHSGQILFCSFAPLIIEQPAPVGSATLSLTFSVKPEEEEASEPEPLDDSPQVEEVILEPVLEQEEPLQEEGGEVEGATTEVPQEDPPTLEEPTETETAEPAEVETPEPETVSFHAWRFSFLTALAQESEEPVEAPEEVSQEPSEEEPIPESPEESYAPSEEVHTEESSEPLEDTEEEPVPLEEEELVEELPIEEEGDVLGESDEEPLIEESEVAALASLSYTVDGVIWRDIDVIEIQEGEMTFPLELKDTNEVENLVVRLVTESVEQEIGLVKVSLTVVANVALEEEAVLEVATDVQPTLPEPRSYDREFVIDPAATHACDINPESLDVTRQSALQFFVALSHGTSTDPELLELGSMPYGIDMRFAETGAYRLRNAERRDEVRVEVEVLPGAQQGLMSVPIIYTKEGKEDSVVICQIHINNL